MARGFSIGDEAVVLLGSPDGHSRVPDYLRGRAGRVIAIAGSFVLADDSARGVQSPPQWTYTVKFRATDVWGVDADDRASITAELWESYLEPRK